jgi:Tripartite tricarboxylate transporter family receptor
MGVSGATSFRWKRKCGGLGPSELREPRRLGGENTKPKKLVADFGLDKAMLRDVSARKPWRLAAGAFDTYARIMAPRLLELLGGPVVIDNRPGANGNIGMAEVQRALPDGLTVLFAAIGSLSIDASMYRSPRRRCRCCRRPRAGSPPRRGGPAPPTAVGR